MIDEEYFQLRTMLRAMHEWLANDEYLRRPFTYLEWGALSGPWSVRVAKLVEFFVREKWREKSGGNRQEDHDPAAADENVGGKSVENTIPCRLLLVEPTDHGVAAALENLALNDVRCEQVHVWQGYLGAALRRKEDKPVPGTDDADLSSPSGNSKQPNNEAGSAGTQGWQWTDDGEQQIQQEMNKSPGREIPDGGASAPPSTLSTAVTLPPVLFESWRDARKIPDDIAVLQSAIGDVMTPVSTIDVVDMDIQGQEYKTVRHFLPQLTRLARRVHVGTHEKFNHKRVRGLFLEGGESSPFSLEQDYVAMSAHTIEHYGNVLFRDGILSMRNRNL